jgi:hypothetical protein
MIVVDVESSMTARLVSVTDGTSSSLGLKEQVVHARSQSFAFHVAAVVPCLDPVRVSIPVATDRFDIALLSFLWCKAHHPLLRGKMVQWSHA